MIKNIRRRQAVEDKKNSTAPIILSIIVFVIGLGLGYYLWGIHRQVTTDYKEMLGKTIDYIATIEHKNQKLLKKVDTLENELDMAKKEAKEAPEAFDSKLKDLNAKLDALQQENNQLKGRASENQALKQKVTALTKEAEILRAHLALPETTGDKNLQPKK